MINCTALVRVGEDSSAHHGAAVGPSAHTETIVESVSGPDQTSDRLVRLGWLSRGTLNTKDARVIPGQHAASVAAVLLL